MQDTTRRRFLGATGAGAAAVAVAPATAYAKESVRSRNSADEPVVAYISDAKSDEVTLLVGEREVVVRDRDLATRILNAAGR
ncbi:MAG: twin-arginine translocation signal domain-containing protein [Nocardioides sp.]